MPPPERGYLAISHAGEQLECVRHSVVEHETLVEDEHIALVRVELRSVAPLWIVVDKRAELRVGKDARCCFDLVVDLRVTKIADRTVIACLPRRRQSRVAMVSRMRLGVVVLGIALLLQGCGTEKRERSAARQRVTGPQTVAIGATGYVVDVPGGMVAESDSTTVMFDHGPAISTIEARPVVSEHVTQETCEGSLDIEQETLPDGGVFVSCRPPTSGFAGIAELHAGNEINIRCGYVVSTPKAAETAQAICRSIRKS
jgi:hypothetical protein